MIRTGPFRRQQQEGEIDRLVVQRFEIDRGFQTREDADDLLDTGSLPWGMAIPLPTPVEPRRSRCRMTSKISRSGRPVIFAALAESS